jgi:hypothetical protein
MEQSPPEARGRRIRRFLARVLGVAATGALLGVGVVIVLMISGGREDSAGGPSAEAAAQERTATATAREDRPRKLSRRARAARRAAVAAVRAQDYEPVSLATWEPRRTLQALVAAPAENPKGGRRVFFFVGRKAVGTDFQQPSVRVKVAGRRTARAITLRYRLYGPGNASCCPQGEHRQVRFRWDGKTVAPVGALPDPLARVAR